MHYANLTVMTLVTTMLLWAIYAVKQQISLYGKHTWRCILVFVLNFAAAPLCIAIAAVRIRGRVHQDARPVAEILCLSLTDAEYLALGKVLGKLGYSSSGLTPAHPEVVVLFTDMSLVPMAAHRLVTSDALSNVFISSAEDVIATGRIPGVLCGPGR